MKISNILNRRNRILLRELVVTDFKLRYQGSTLGYLWSLLKPLFLFGILYLVFGTALKFGAKIPHYPVYLLLGIVLWNFFSEATKQGAAAIVGSGSLLRKINLPRYIVVVSATVSALINLCLNLVVVFFFVVINHTEVQPMALVLFPLLILELYVFSLAIAFFLSAINVRYRDIQHIWDVFVQAGFYATPIIFTVSMVFERSETIAFWMLALNPMAQIIQDARSLLITPATQTLSELSHGMTIYLLPLAIISTVTLLSSIYFRKRSKSFAEDV